MDTEHDRNLQISDPHNVPITFVNDVAGIGFLNGVLNVTLTAARWTPDTLNATQFPVDSVVVARHRLDLKCAINLRDLLTQIIDANTKPAPTIQ